MEAEMENSSSQGVAVLVLLIAFTFLSVGMFYEGNIIAIALGVLTLGASIAMFRKIKVVDNPR